MACAPQDGGRAEHVAEFKTTVRGLLVKVPDAPLAAVNLTRDDFHGD